jgi:hypothetical protein
LYYRINNGTWSSVLVYPNVGSSSYTLAISLTLQINDVVDYYLDQSQCTPYGYGNGGLYTGGGQSSTTIVSGFNGVYFNICSITGDGVSYFCANC